MRMPHIMHAQKIVPAGIQKADREACEAVTTCTECFLNSTYLLGSTGSSLG